MLKKFFMNVLSSFMGAWIALVLFGVVAVVVCIGMVAKLGLSDSSPAGVSKGSVLTIELAGTLVERETPAEVDYISLLQGDLSKPQTLSGLVEAIGEAKENKNISAIYLKCGGLSASPATLNALRDALLDFKESGKKIIAYGDHYLMGEYYVASVSDRMILNPGGMVTLQGLGGTNFYLKGLFDKIGVEFQVVKVGTYKSAVEPYIHTEMSQPARAQLDTLYGNMWLQIRENIASSRKKLTPATIDSIVNGFVFTRKAEYVKKAGLVDELAYERTLDSIVGKIVDKDPKKLNYVAVGDLLGETSWGWAYASKKQVAVLYACGEIVDGGGNSTIDFNRMVPEIVRLADDDNVKAMVLRVNSPGGSAFGSEQIGEALDYFQSKGKPLAVSMGDYAASGGYWISAGANRIFADPLTITGSIGIFGLIPNAKGLIEKLGVTPQTVSTNPQADFPSLVEPMTTEQQAAMQRFVEDGYDKFVARVAKGRHMKESKVRVIGEGRVWDAVKALKIGLVDELGSLQDATDWAAEKAELGESYDVAVYPQTEPSVWDFIPELGGIKLTEAIGRSLGNDYSEQMVKFAASVIGQHPVQARMPYMRVAFGQ